MRNRNYKLFLYKPSAANYVVDSSQYRAEFLGELKADNVSASIKLQEISTLSFTLPENILGTFNTRLDEVLDNYVVELWYGDLTGSTLGTDYFPTTGDRLRFIITNSNLQYTDGARTYSFQANSIEYILEFKQLLNWPGIKIKDFYRTITYNATNNDFEEVDQTDYTVSTSTNSFETKYITVPTTTASTEPPSTFDIFVYQYRRNDNDTVNSENSIIEFTGGVNDEGFKPGFYVPTLDSNGKVTAVSISLPNDITEFDAADTNFEIFLYDNPTSRHFAVGINTDDELKASDMYLDLAQDAESSGLAEFNGFTFTTQEVYSINGLKLEHILLGTQQSRIEVGDPPELVIDNTKLTIDGILYDTGFTIGEIDDEIADKYRSNIELNNITKYEAIKNIAESFDCIAIFNTIEKTVSFYPDKNEKVFTNNGLIITKNNYLKSISNDINATKIVTKVYGAGKDNLGIELITPNGNAAWEDYSYFLDTYYVEYDRENLETMSNDGTTGVSFTDFTTGTLSRWMDSTEALALAKWQYARDYFHDIMLGELDPTISQHDRYYDLYNLRSADLNTFVKEETKYFELKAIEYKYKYIYERYVKINREGGDTETEGYEADYLIKYNDAVAASAFALLELNKLHYNLYNERLDGTIAVSGDADYSTLAAIQTNSYATKIAEVQGFLNKTNWSIDATKLKAFEKEVVMTDSKLDNELDLLLAVQEFTKENCIPVITMDVDVVDFLATKDYSVDWNKAVIGEVVNIYYPEFNIDTTAQLREISIDFQANTLKFVISTYRQYSRLPFSYISKQIRTNYDNSQNLFKYIHDDSKVSNVRAKLVNKKLERVGFAAENAPVKFGAKSPDGTTSTEISGEGFVSKVIGVDPVLEAFTYQTTKTLAISDGTLLAKNIVSGSLTTEVELSGDNGFVIRSIDGSDNVTTQAYIDTDGSAVFGPLNINNTESSIRTYTTTNGGLVATGDSLNVSPGPDTRTFTLGKQVYVDNIQFVVSNFTSDVLLTVDIYRGITLLKRVNPIIDSNGTKIIDNVNSYISKFVFTLAAVGGSAIIADSGVAANYYLPSIQLNNLTVSSSGQISTSESLFGLETKDKILIKSDESASVTEPKQIILTTPATALASDRTIRFPDADGTIALLSDLNSDIIVYETPDSTRTTSTYTTDLEIADLAANSYYEVTFVGSYYKTSTDSAGFRFGFTVSNTTGTPTLVGNAEVATDTTTGRLPANIYAISSSIVTGSVLATIPETATITRRYAQFKGVLYTGTSPKTLRLQTATSSTLTNGVVGLKAGSFLKVRKIN